MNVRFASKFKFRNFGAVRATYPDAPDTVEFRDGWLVLLDAEAVATWEGRNNIAQTYKGN